MSPLLFQPIYQLRPWGGRALGEVLHRKDLPGGPVGESWDIVDRPEACSVVAGGPLEGRTLREVLLEHSARIMGPSWEPSRPFPILVKWLDCRERLSLQVHPPAEIALSLGGEPKTENWYLAHTTPGAALLAGLTRGVTPEGFAKALQNNDLEPLVSRHPVVSGDSLFVPSGHLHAIDAGCLILEIQQNSDTTYRVYDWGRVGLDGRPRQLHVRESLASINFRDSTPGLLHTAGCGGETLLVDSPVFRLRKVTLPAGETWSHHAGEGPALVGVVRGGLVSGDETPLPFGTNCLLSHAFPCKLVAGVEGAEFLVTDRFV